MVVQIARFIFIGREKHAILVEKHPQCFEHHKENFWSFLLLSMAFVGIAKEVITRLFYALIERSLSDKHIKELKNDSTEKHEFVYKLSNHVFKAIYYSVVTGLFIYFLRGCRLLHWYFGGELDTFERIELFKNYPCIKVPDRLVDLFLFKLGYYIYESIYSCLFHRKRHDFTENLTHHICTLGLVYASYSFNWFDYGSLVFFLTGFTDIFVSLMRITYFWENFALKITSFILMLGSFIIFRDIYQGVIQWEIYKHVHVEDHPELLDIKELTSIMQFLLSVLMILNYFWTYLMVKGLWQRMSG